MSNTTNESIRLSVRLRLSAMMFLQYFTLSAWIIPLSTYLLAPPERGGLWLAASQVVLIYGTTALGAILSPLFVGVLADRFFNAERVLAGLHLLGALVLGGLVALMSMRHGQLLRIVEVLQESTDLGASQLRQLPEVLALTESIGQEVFWLVLAYATLTMPAGTLTNVICFRNLSDPGRQFGPIRVFGSIGWIAAGLTVGFGLNAISPEPLLLAAGAAVLLAGLCLILPPVPPLSKRLTVADLFGLSALGLMLQRRFAVFFLALLLSTMCQAFYNVFGNPFLHDLGTTAPTAVQTLAQSAEIVLMTALPLGLRWLGYKGMMLVGLAGWAIRYWAFASLSLPLILYVGLPMHGVSFSCFVVVASLFLDREAPPHLRASAQGLVTFLTMGVGLFAGNWLAGQVVERFTVDGVRDWPSIWLVPMVAALLTTAMFAVGLKEKSDA
jgi:nucleoside transporter